MTLAERLAAYPAADEPEITQRTEFDGSAGYIQTKGLPADQPPDYTAILEQFGYDSTKVRIIGAPRTSRWEVPYRPHEGVDEKGKPILGELTTRWLTSYRFHIEPVTMSVDLPALYAEVARTRAARRFDPKVGDSTVVVCWADIQTGKVDHSGGLTELLERLDEKREALESYLKRGNFDHIVVADVGDIIEGFDNFPAQHRTNSLSLMDQIDVAAVEFWKTIQLCSRYAPVDVLSIPSNHCAWRRGGKNLAGKPTDDWGLHISQRLERQNRDAGLPVAFHRAAEWEETLQFDIRGTRLGLAHGHQASGPNGVTNWWAKMTHAGVLDCHILLTGHFHFPSLRPSGRDALTNKSRWHIQASTLDNGSSWVRNKYGEDGDPALTVFQVNDSGFDVSSFALL